MRSDKTAIAEEAGTAGDVSSASHRAVRVRWWWRVPAWALVIYAIYCIVLYCYQDRLVFPADCAPAPLKRPLPRPIAQQVIVDPIETTEGHNESWFIPAPGASAQHPAAAVVFLHGNAEVIDHQDYVVRGYHRLGLSVLLPEYRGYGVARGEASQDAIREDNVRFYDDLVGRPDVDAKRVIFHGRSLGGGVACDLATQRRPAALILECTFYSAASLAHKYLAPSFLCKYPFRNDLLLRQATFPVLISHGTRDTIIPVAHGRALRELVPGAVYREYNCGHNDWPGPENEADWWETTRVFLTNAGVLQSPATQAAGLR